MDNKTTEITTLIGDIGRRMLHRNGRDQHDFFRPKKLAQDQRTQTTVVLSIELQDIQA